MTTVENAVEVDAATAAPPPQHRHRKPLSERLMSVWAVLVYLFLFAPIIVIFIYSFNNGRLLVAFQEFGFLVQAAVVEDVDLDARENAHGREAFA